MIEQTYYLDMIPGESAPPVVHVSQFDVNSRTLTFNLMKGGVAYEPDVGMTVTLDGTKPDNTAFSYPMTVDGSSVSITLQTQMTVVSGHVRCEVTVSNASGQIGSANFILAVEESAIDTGAISDTDIPIFEDLKNQAQQAAAEATAAAQTVSAILPENVGTVGQVLTKTGTGAEWETPASGGTWGSITGTLSDQTDLQNALDAKSNIGNIATIESSPASANHAVGEFIVYNGQMYSVISAITAGNALVVGTNISATSAGAELTSLKNGLSTVNSTLSTVTPLIKRFSITSGSPYTEETGSYASLLLIGFAQGIGSVAILVKKSGSNISAFDITTGSSFSSSYLTFESASNGITVKSTNTSRSWFTAIVGGL